MISPFGADFFCAGIDQEYEKGGKELYLCSKNVQTGSGLSLKGYILEFCTETSAVTLGCYRIGISRN